MSTEKRSVGPADLNCIAPGLPAARNVTAPDAYRLAAFLAARFGAERIVDICRQPTDRTDFPQTLGATLEAGPDVDEQRRFLSRNRWVELDALATNNLVLSEDLLRSSVLVCANILELLPQPTDLLSRLALWSRSALATIITTPNRDAAPRSKSQWNLSTFSELLGQQGMFATFTGLTVSNDSQRDKSVIIVIVDQCPVHLGRTPPPDFRPLALMPTYNDADIAPQVVTKLLDDGFDVDIRDNWSTDGTFEHISAMAACSPGLSVGRFPDKGPSEHHDYLGVLAWKEEIAARNAGRWIASVDSDEIRTSPWSGVSFRGGLYVCERMGFTAADLTVLDFRPVDERFAAGADPDRALRHFQFGRTGPHFHQIKTWRQGTERVDLTGGAGHDARFQRRRIFPYKFVLKHYSLRNSDQARRKVFTDRKPRYSPITRSRGWHTQYDHCKPNHTFIRQPADLLLFNDEHTRRDYLVELVSGIGIIRNTSASA